MHSGSNGTSPKPGRPPTRVALSEEQRAELLAVGNSGLSSYRDAIRAKVVLAAADGQATREIAEAHSVSVDLVSTWRIRFARDGMAGLHDRPRTGCPARITPVQRCQIVSVACEPAPETDGKSGWTLDRLREEVERRSIVRISRSRLHELLDQADLKPHKKKMWLHSPDPQFREKVTEIVDLYINPPAGATVLCIDEKTGMQAVERKHPDRPAAPGKPARREFEYIRHGTQSLISSFNVKTGLVQARCNATRTGEDLEEFMGNVASTTPGEVHVVWDNLNIHKGERWTKFNERHGGRFVFHYTPLHASWVNQIEIWFGILQRACLANGSFKSTAALREAVETFVAYWNAKAKHPFRWSFTGYPRTTNAPPAPKETECRDAS
jgi:transposase